MMRYNSSLSDSPVLLFDFGCVLVGLSKQRCIDALEKIGCGKIAYYVDECRQEDLFHDLEIGGSIEAFCDEARRQSSVHTDGGREATPSNEEICWAWNELLTDIPVEKLRLIKHLHDDLGYRTAVLSNTNKIHWEKACRDFFTIDGLTVDDYFDDIFLSCEMGIVKPDDEIFEAVIERMNTQPGNILFFDDSAKNCMAARQQGIRAMPDPTGTLWMTICNALPPVGERRYASAVANQQQPSTSGVGAIIGNFDGVHKGHQYVIDMLRTISAERQYKPVAITFDSHPRAIFDKSFNPQYLSTVDEKTSLLKEELGGEVVVLHFTKEFAALDARTFMEKVLRDELGVKLLLLGYDNHFGRRNAQEGFEQYQQYGKELGIEVILAEPCDVDGVRVSSSYVRHKIMGGDVEEAARCLGRPYSITGTVVEGFQEGRKIGFPTANILPSQEKLLPSNGVYAVQIHIEGDSSIYSGMTNIGSRPTFHGSNITIETNIFDFIGDIYGKKITIDLLTKIRDERLFSSPEELKEQIKKDSETIKNL